VAPATRASITSPKFPTAASVAESAGATGFIKPVRRSKGRLFQCLARAQASVDADRRAARPTVGKKLIQIDPERILLL